MQYYAINYYYSYNVKMAMYQQPVGTFLWNQELTEWYYYRNITLGVQ